LVAALMTLAVAEVTPNATATPKKIRGKWWGTFAGSGPPGGDTFIFTYTLEVTKKGRAITVTGGKSRLLCPGNEDQGYEPGDEFFEVTWPTFTARVSVDKKNNLVDVRKSPAAAPLEGVTPSGRPYRHVIRPQIIVYGYPRKKQWAIDLQGGYTCNGKRHGGGAVPTYAVRK
jgi:hypothetical protein